MTGRQNLEFFGALDNIPKKELSIKINDLLHFVELNDVSNKLFNEYSSGMKQRLAIARTLIKSPDALILDEPTRTIDPHGAEKLRKLIYNEIHKSKDKTLIIATHQIQEAEELCNKICLIKNGRILAFNSMKQIKDKYSSLKSFYNQMMGADNE